MFLEFLKKHKTKTLLIGAGFLVIAGIVSTVAWVYLTFLVSHDDFFDAVPSEAVIFWHRSAGQEIDETWFYEVSRLMLANDAADQAQFLFDSLAPKSSETAFAVLPGFEDFIFWSRLDPAEFNTVKEGLEKLDFNYIAEDGGKITITNTKFALKEVLATLSQKNFSLADQKGRLAAWNRVSRSFPAQIYLRDGFQAGNLPAVSLKSDFWEKNQLKVKRTGDGYLYLLATDSRYLAGDAANLLKNTLAVILPETRERKLPDGTLVREIIANPEVFTFEKDKIAGREVDYLSVPAMGQEFFLVLPGKQAILSTSKELLANFLVRLGRQPEYYGENIIDLARGVAKWLTSDFDGAIFGVKVDKL
jgi:hypothetical protein